jgi:dihydrofolate reductase
MRKITAGLFISLDGVVESPSEWAYPHFNDEAMGAINEGLPQADAILLGRHTYLEFAELWPGREGPMGDFLNQTPKHVVSSTLDTLEWGPAALLEGDLAEALTELKRQPGRNIQVPGSPRLVGSLLRDGLLDELTLMAAPVVVGAGARLFDEIGGRIELELVESRAYGSVLSSTYRTVLDRSH